MNTVYGNVTEAVSGDIAKPIGPTFTTTTYEYANLLHDLITGRSATGILPFLNETPIEWYSKRQKTVKTATYGSEFIAAWIATNQITDLRTTLCYLGVKILDKSIMFGDNQAVITSSTLPELPLNKRHNILSYHQVREAVALKMLYFKFVKSCDNTADILSKKVAGPQAWTFAYPLWFCAG